MRRVNLTEAAPDLYKAMFALDNAAQKFAVSAGITHGFLHVLKLRASQINGCAYCLRMHTRDALAAGESSDRISVLPAWRESSYFTQSERASLALIEAVTQIAEGHIPDAVYTEAAAVLSADAIAAVEWIGVTINSWNRIAIASRTPVEP